MIAVQYDPKFQITKKNNNWWIYASIGIISIPLMLLLIKRNKII